MKDWLKLLLALPVLAVLFPLCTLLALGAMLHDAWHGRPIRH